MWLINLMIAIALYTSVHAQEIPKILNCKCVEKINKDYGSESGLKGEKKWLGFEKSIPLRDKIFINLESDKPIVKSITPPYKHFPEGKVSEFESIVIHRLGTFIMLKWINLSGNKAWVASINLKEKKAIVTESYEGATSFGINVEILDCN